MVVEKGASGDFDYRREESDGSDGVDVFDEEEDYASEADFDYLLAKDESLQGDGFDAFDENNWVEVLDPVPTPWYRSRQALTLLIASGTALSAIVVSVVLLVFRESPAGDKPVPTPTTAPVTTPVATATSENPPAATPPEPTAAATGVTAAAAAGVTAAAATPGAIDGTIHDGEGAGGH